MLFFSRVFAKFYQSSASGLRVQECDVKTFSAFTWSLVDETAAVSLSLSESVCHSILDSESYVLYASTAAIVGDEFRDSAVFACTFKELDFSLSDLEERRAHFLIGHLFNGKAFKT